LSAGRGLRESIVGFVITGPYALRIVAAFERGHDGFDSMFDEYLAE
jgi:hypothetical protein